MGGGTERMSKYGKLNEVLKVKGTWGLMGDGRSGGAAPWWRRWTHS